VDRIPCVFNPQSRIHLTFELSFRGKIEALQGQFDPLIKRGGGTGPLKPRQPLSQSGANSGRKYSGRWERTALPAYLSQERYFINRL